MFCWPGFSSQYCYGLTERPRIENKLLFFAVIQLTQTNKDRYKYTHNTDHLLYVCEYACQYEALCSQIDHTEEERVKDQQGGFVPVEQHVTERMGLIC